MSRNFLISGNIVAKDSDKESFEDITPSQVQMFLNGLDENEEVVFDFNSTGGSVYAGIAIANLIRKASESGHKTTANIISIAASIASVIACACDEMQMRRGAWLMMHLPWTVTMGNAIDLQKDIESLDRCKQAIISFYRRKFDLSDEEIEKMLVEETWIDCDSISTYKLKCGIVDSDEEPLRIAAKLLGNFKHTPKNLVMENNEVKNESAETESVEKTETVENKETTETVEKTEEENVKAQLDEMEAAKEEVKEAVKNVADMISLTECEARVSGMQSAMAKKLDAMRKDYEAKILDFTNEMKAKDQELTAVKNEVTSLNLRLEKSESELSKATSALEEKAKALAVLHNSVLTPATATDWRSLKGQAFFDYLKANPQVAKQHNS